jgi:hypothetical protein
VSRELKFGLRPAERALIAMAALFGWLISTAPARAQLSDRCVVSILNRTIQVSSDGTWVLPNVPANQGKVRARATCVLANGTTTAGQSDYFSMPANTIVTAGEIVFQNVDAIPVSLRFSSNSAMSLSNRGATAQLVVTAVYADGSTRDVSGSSNGTNYASSNCS